MNDLDRALGDIRDIRRNMAQNTVFRGYGPLALCTTAAFAVIAALLQAHFVPLPTEHPRLYVGLWTSTGVLSAAWILVHAVTRSRRLHSALADDMISLAIEQFLPAAVAGCLLTIVLLLNAPQSIWMLPGLWQLIYSLGVFASCRFLPRAMLSAAAWFLLSGLLCLSLGNQRALQPWTMASAFGIGQTLIGLVLYATAKGEAHDA
ncbi:MAG: hypothetical protein PW792_12965 [Acidobacteriaceae bacterium]|nr:hypothetical protein [Acidobacteriaceae bacterium]